jgi:hypothetical protein
VDRDERPARRSLRNLGCLVIAFAWSCVDPPPHLVEADIPVSRTVTFSFDESRIEISGETPPGPDEASIVRAISRASTQRFIDARATQTEPSPEGGVEGTLGLHEGWRQEFFDLQRTNYEIGIRLPAGDVLLWDITPGGVTRQVEAGGIIPGVVNNYTGIITRVIEVPTASSYSFRVDSDDGTIGTLQNLSGGLDDVRLLWYDWRNQPLIESVLQTEGFYVEPGTYLLTIHYYEEWHHAGYLIEMFVEAADGVGDPGMSIGIGQQAPTRPSSDSP